MAVLRPIIIAAIVAALCLILLNIWDSRDAAGDIPSQDASMESRLSLVISSIDGVGKANVVINGDEGALVVAQGADDLAVRLEIIRAVKALLGIDSERIEVLAMGG